MYAITDGSRVNTLPRLGKMAVQNVHSEDDAIITAFSKGGGTPNGTSGAVRPGPKPSLVPSVISGVTVKRNKSRRRLVRSVLVRIIRRFVGGHG